MVETGLELSHDLLCNKEKIHARLHAKSLDKSLGYKIPKIEVKLLQKYRAYDRFNDDSNRKQHYQGTQTWIGLHPQALQTPYCDIYEALTFLKDVEVKHIVDIGAGYGRVGIVQSVVFPESRFTGYEILKQRQAEGNRVFTKFGLDNCNIELVNVLEQDFILPQAEVYFIYDFSEIEDVYEILETLSRRVDEYEFYLIIRGDRVDRLLKNKFKNIWRSFIFLESSDLKIYTSKKF